MRRILIEHARRRLAAKRGAGVEVVDLDGLEISSPLADDDQLLAVNEALEKFAAVDERKAELVKLRYFVGLNFEEAAAALGIAVPTAKQWWAYARSWLTVEMRGAGAALTVRSSNQSGFVALRHMRGPGLTGFRLDVGEAGARRRIGNADEMLAGRALNLPAGMAGIALQRLVAVGTVEFEFVRCS